MAGGRPNKGVGHIEKLNIDEATKERVRAILSTINGEISVKEAAEMLDISESRFHELRDEFLQGGAQRLEPRPKGRPGKEIDPKDKEIGTLKERIRDLEIEVETARVREEIALVMPEVLERRAIAAQEKLELEKKRQKRRKEKEKKKAKKKQRKIQKKK